MLAAPHRRGVLVLLLAGSTLTVMAGAVISPVLNLIRTDLVVDGTAVGLIITTHGLVIAVVSPLAGWATDRWGVRRPLAVGLLLYGLAGGAGLVVRSYPSPAAPCSGSAPRSCSSGPPRRCSRWPCCRRMPRREATSGVR